MMPDLGAYAFEVTLAYVGWIVLLVAIVFLSWQQSRAARRRLDDAEGRKDG